MKRIIVTALACSAMVAVVAGCAKKPETELSHAKAAVESVIADGAEKYAAEDAKRLTDALQAATDEMNVQDGKMLKNYAKATEMLVKAKADADALKPTLAEKKNAARKSAEEGYAAAGAAVKEAKSLLENAPRGKGTAADIEALRSDVKGLEQALPEVQTLIGQEDYLAAGEKAKAINEQAGAVKSEIRTAMEKVKLAKKQPAKKKG